MRAFNNPRSSRTRATQQRFTVNVWASIMGDYLLSPYILPPQLDSDKYLVFLQAVLPKLLIDVPVLLGAVCGFNRTGHHLIMEGVYRTIWTRHLETCGLSVTLRPAEFLRYILAVVTKIDRKEQRKQESLLPVLTVPAAFSS
ncbi:hypothetical protein TNCV_346441 [Trichonephila clavipes]|nr:hypothetical protein TNCV_346441 [Trichonephila clavipes]